MNNKGRSPKNKPIFENDEYRITKIPLNYAIEVKIMVKGSKRHEQVKLLPEQFYVSLEWGIDQAHDMAKLMINKYKK